MGFRQAHNPASDQRDTILFSHLRVKQSFSPTKRERDPQFQRQIVSDTDNAL